MPRGLRFEIAPRGASLRRTTSLLAGVCAVAAGALFVALLARLVPAWLDYQAFAAELLWSGCSSSDSEATAKGTRLQLRRSARLSTPPTLAVVALISAGCSTTEAIDITGQQPYARFIGREYRIIREVDA